MTARIPVRKTLWMVLLVCFSTSVGAINLVSNTNDNGIGSLRDAITQANKNDTIAFLSNLIGDTILLTSGQIAINKEILIFGSAENPIVISGNLNSRIFEITQGTNVIIRGLELIRGNVNGLIPGGAIANYGNLTVSQTRIRYNVADYGGGLYVDTIGSVFLFQSEIEGNIARISGGGMYLQGVGILSGCTFADNSTLSKDGAGIFNSGGYLELTNSTISGNQANVFGGGIYNRGEIIMNHCTIADNHATKGGGILNEVSRGEITGSHNIVATNAADEGPDIYDPTGTDVISLGYNLIGDISFLSNAFGTETDIYGAYGNVISPKLDSLTYQNNAFTKIHPLQCFSVAVNRGSTGSSVLTDQIGQDRRYGNRLDIGAYELHQDLCEVALGLESPSASTGSFYHGSVFPNPANERIHIVMDNDVYLGEIVFKIYDIKGKKAFQHTIPSQIQQELLLLDLPGFLPNGTYIIEVSAQMSSYRTKLIISK